MTTAKDHQVRHLIPVGWEPNKEKWPVRTEDDLAFFGKSALRRMIAFWQDACRDLLTSAQEQRKTARELKAAHFKPAALGSAFEMPAFERVDLNQFDTPTPVDYRSFSREPSATSYQVCGWCQHNGREGRLEEITTCELERDHLPAPERQLIPVEAIVRYRSLAGKTDRRSLARRERLDGQHPGVREAAEKDSEPAPAKRVRSFYTPCLFKTATRKTWETIIRYEQDIGASRAQEARTIARKVIPRLQRILRRAEEKPLLPRYRPEDYFDVNDPVIVYRDTRPAGIPPFLRGHVVARKGGRLDVCFAEKLRGNTLLHGYGLRFDVRDESILRATDFDYMCTHPDFLRLWAATRPHGYVAMHGPNIFHASYVWTGP